MPEYKFVRDKDTGHEFSVVASAFDSEAQTDLKKDSDSPLPTNYKTASKKEQSNG